jgi:uncharacterized membrane protein
LKLSTGNSVLEVSLGSWTKASLLAAFSIVATFAKPCFAADKWPQHVWDPLLPHAHHYLHPPTVHFPIVFAVIEFFCLLLFIPTRNQCFDKLAKTFLFLTGLSVLVVAPAGLYDAGVDLGQGNPLIAGLQDRIANFTHFSDALSLHVLYILAFDLLLVLRIVWRIKCKKLAYNQFITYTIVTAISLLILLGAAQVGGSMSHS